MNKVLFLLAFVLIPLQMKGQSVRFIEPDKTWYVKGLILPSYEIEEICRFTVESDTLIDGVHYMRLFMEKDGKTSVGGIFREEGDIVYRYCPELQQEYVFYDFTLDMNAPKTVTYLWFGEKWDYLCEATAVDSQILEDGTEARKIKFTTSVWDGFQYLDYPDNAWIEGIGSVFHPLENVWPLTYSGSPLYTVACVKRGDEVIYSNTASGVEVLKAPKTLKDSRTYDLQGRPVAKDPNHGIIIRNGRKVWQK